MHAPGTALTIELQEDSDVFAMLQALNAGRIISKELLWKDVRPQDRQDKGERFILELIDWERNGDPDFYSHHHLEPQPIHGSEPDGGREDRIFYRTRKFSGTRVIVRPGGSYRCADAGVYSLFVWRGTGRYGGHDVVGGRPGLDELLVTHDRAITGVDVVNAGGDELHLVKFFGPDLSDDVVRADVAG